MSQTSSRILTHCLAVLYILGVAFMAYQYAHDPNRWREVGTSTGAFYRQFSHTWFWTNQASLKTALNSGNPDRWHQMWLRTAMARWRLKTISGLPFESLMGWWEKGMLPNMPSRREWIRLLSENDHAWLTARRSAMRTGSSTVKTTISGDKAIIWVNFPDTPFTTQVGSLISVQVECDPKEYPASPPSLYWSTTATSISNWQRRLPTLSDPQPVKDSDRVTFKMEVDYSWEPAWITPGARANRFRFAPMPSWKVLEVKCTDSPLLPVP